MTHEEFIAEARPVFNGLKNRRAKVILPENIDLAEEDARNLIYALRDLVADASRESGRALDHADFIKEAREMEDQARELIA